MPELSRNQQHYLRALKQQKRTVVLARVFLFIAFFLLWEIAADFHWIDSFVFSSPSRVAASFVRMASDGSLLIHVGVTLAETLLSFALVVILGLGSAILLWLCPRLSLILEPYLVVLNSLPKSALAPLLIVWLGANMSTIVVAGISVAIFGAILNLYTGFQEISPEKIKLIYTLHGTKKDALIKVVLPGTIPNFISIMKVSIGLCLIGVIIGEFISSKQGLGYLIIYGSQVFQLDLVIMSIMILCVIAAALYAVIALLEKTVAVSHTKTLV